MAETNFSSDAFRKGATSGMPSSHVRDGPSFRQWKSVLGNVVPTTGEVTPIGITVDEAFAEDVPKHNVMPRHWDIYSMLSLPSLLPKHSAQTLLEGHRRAGYRSSRKAISDVTPSS